MQEAPFFYHQSRTPKPRPTRPFKSRPGTSGDTLFLFRDAKINFKAVKQLALDNRNIRLDLTDAIDPFTNEDSYALTQYLLDSRQYNETDRDFDSVQSVRQFFYEPEEVVASRAFPTHTKESRRGLPGEIPYSVFSKARRTSK